MTKLKAGIASLTNHVWRTHTPNTRRTEYIFKFSYVSVIYVEKQLRSLKRSKSTGADDLPPGMIKDCAKAISKSLAHIINISLKSGKMPSMEKSQNYSDSKWVQY